jgi:hypothetical protein
VSTLRVVCLAAAAVAFVATLVVGEPEVFRLLLLCGVVLFVAGAGSIAADAFPLRSGLALACSALTPPAAIGLILAVFAGVPPVAAVIGPLVLSLAPVAIRRA